MVKIAESVFCIEPSRMARFDSCKYIIDSEDGLVLIDPGLYVDFIDELAREGFDAAEIRHCLITHAHLDHYGACHELRATNGDIKFYIHELDAGRIEQKVDRDIIEELVPGYDYEPVRISKKLIDKEVLAFGRTIIKCIHTPGHSPGASAYLLESDESRIVFAGDIGGTALRLYGGDIDDYRASMQRLIDLNADILCDGHEGNIAPKKKVSRYIRDFIKFNKYLCTAVEERSSSSEAWLDLSLQAYKMGEYEFALDACGYLLEIDPGYPGARRLQEKIEKHNPAEISLVRGMLERYSDFSSR